MGNNVYCGERNCCFLIVFCYYSAGSRISLKNVAILSNNLEILVIGSKNGILLTITYTIHDN